MIDFIFLHSNNNNNNNNNTANISIAQLKQNSSGVLIAQTNTEVCKYKYQ